MMICLEILLYYECSTVSNTFHVYQAFNFRKIKNLFVVSARFCEINFILQVLQTCIPLKNWNQPPLPQKDDESMIQVSTPTCAIYLVIIHLEVHC